VNTPTDFPAKLPGAIASPSFPGTTDTLSFLSINGRGEDGSAILTVEYCFSVRNDAEVYSAAKRDLQEASLTLLVPGQTVHID